MKIRNIIYKSWLDNAFYMYMVGIYDEKAMEYELRIAGEWYFNNK